MNHFYENCTLTSHHTPTDEFDDYINVIKNGFSTGNLVTDVKFDRIFTSLVAKSSSVHWTSVDVAVLSFDLLDLEEGTRILDVGSGSGKYCLIGGLYTKAHFTGIEQRQNLAEMANQLANKFELPNVSFLSGDALAHDWVDFDVIYLFNPFYENVMPAGLRIDLETKVSYKRYKNNIMATLGKLSKLKVGTRVITYYGFGGKMPDNFKLIKSMPVGCSRIEIWLKT